MAQPIKKTLPKPLKKVKKKTVQQKKKRSHPEYGTSKLEERFAKNFLDALGVKYVYQFKAPSIGRYFDFYCPNDHLLIEVDGDYYHSYGLVYENMSPMQKRNHRVDAQKDHWAVVNGFPLLRIWEHDINNHPEKVMATLKERLQTAKEKKIIRDKKKMRH